MRSYFCLFCIHRKSKSLEIFLIKRYSVIYVNIKHIISFSNLYIPIEAILDYLIFLVHFSLYDLCDIWFSITFCSLWNWSNCVCLIIFILISFIKFVIFKVHLALWFFRYSICKSFRTFDCPLFFWISCFILKFFWINRWVDFLHLLGLFSLLLFFNFSLFFFFLFFSFFKFLLSSFFIL